MVSELAEVAELVDAHVSGTCERELMEVQVLSSALRSNLKIQPRWRNR